MSMVKSQIDDGSSLLVHHLRSRLRIANPKAHERPAPSHVSPTLETHSILRNQPKNRKRSPPYFPPSQRSLATIDLPETALQSARRCL